MTLGRNPDLSTRYAARRMSKPKNTVWRIVVLVLKFAVVAIVFVATFILSNILGSIAVWYLARVFVIHAWPRLPHGLRRFILKLEDRALFARARQDQAATPNDDESAFSRNSHRHPHW